MIRTALAGMLAALSLAAPSAALAATATATIDLSTRLDAFPVIMSGQPGCALPPIVPEYSYGEVSFTTGTTAGDNAFELTSLSATNDPAVLLYDGTFDSASPAANLVGCNDNDGFYAFNFPRLIASLPPGTTYTVVVIVPKDPMASSGTMTAELGMGLVPNLVFFDHAVALGATGESMTASSDGTGIIGYSSSDPGVALIDVATGAITTVSAGTTSIVALQAAEMGTGTYGAARAVNTLTVTGGGPTAPVVTSPTASGVTATSASLGGDVSTDGGAAITERGVVYAETSRNGDPVLGGADVTAKTATGTTGAFSVDVTGLTASTGYSFKAYATNSVGTTYTSVATFTTPAAACASPYTQAGYVITGCDANTPSGNSCAANTCAAGYSLSGAITGSVTCTAGSYTGSFGGCAVISYTVTYDGNGNTGGTPPTDGTAYASGASVTVAGAGALVRAGHTFAGWNTAPNGSGASHPAGSTFSITADTTLYAQWTLNAYPITALASPSSGGSVTCTPNPVGHGGSATCTATPAAGSSFSAFSGDCTGTLATCTLGNVQGAKTVTATFTSCPAGSFGLNGMCYACAAGTFSQSPGSTACSACPAGSYNPSPGQTSCTQCQAGTYNAVLGRQQLLRLSGGVDVDGGCDGLPDAQHARLHDIPFRRNAGGRLERSAGRDREGQCGANGRVDFAGLVDHHRRGRGHAFLYGRRRQDPERGGRLVRGLHDRPAGDLHARRQLGIPDTRDRIDRRGGSLQRPGDLHGGRLHL